MKKEKVKRRKHVSVEYQEDYVTECSHKDKCIFIDTIKKEAKQAVFDDIDKFNNFPERKIIDHDWIRINIPEEEYTDLKQRHLSSKAVP